MSVFLQDPDVTIYHGDVLDVLPTLPAESVDCVVTSPPYWGLRDYGTGGQLGLEPTPDEYLARMVGVFREVRRVLAPHGTCWVNMGDSYAHGTPGGGSVFDNGRTDGRTFYEGDKARGRERVSTLGPSLKPKDLVGIPWRLALALQADGWYLRADIIWAKPNPMPESVTDRPTKAHEYVFLLTRQARYFYDTDAVREPAEYGRREWSSVAGNLAGVGITGVRGSATVSGGDPSAGRNLRSVWTIPTQPYPDAHFATYPEELVRRCLLAGCPEGGTVLDPFLGSGTTAHVARKLARKAIGVELNPDYCALAARRLAQLSLLAEPAA